MLYYLYFKMNKKITKLFVSFQSYIAFKYMEKHGTLSLFLAKENFSLRKISKCTFPMETDKYFSSLTFILVQLQHPN